MNFVIHLFCYCGKKIAQNSVECCYLSVGAT